MAKAAEISSSISALTPAPGSVGRFHSDCIAAVDVWARAARVRALRDQVFKPEPRPAAPRLALSKPEPEPQAAIVVPVVAASVGGAAAWYLH